MLCCFLWAFLLFTFVFNNSVVDCFQKADLIKFGCESPENNIKFTIGKFGSVTFTIQLLEEASSFSMWPPEVVSRKPFTRVLNGVVTTTNIEPGSAQPVPARFTCLLINGLEISATMDSNTQVTLDFSWKNNPILNGVNEKNFPKLLIPLSKFSDERGSFVVVFPGIGEILTPGMVFNKKKFITQATFEASHIMPGLNGAIRGCKDDNTYYYIRKNNNQSVTILSFPISYLPPKKNQPLPISDPIDLKSVSFVVVGLLFSYGLLAIITKRMLNKRKTRMAKLNRNRQLKSKNAVH